jgi:beta-N-acetylhexosaminidase
VAAAPEAKAFISGCAGPRLTLEERDFFAAERPFGLILFARNCREKAEIAELTAAFRDAVGNPAAPVLIDQEGGRVQRMKPPTWRAYAPQGVIGVLAVHDPALAARAAWLHGRLIASDLQPLGIDVDCAPVLDVASEGLTEAIGDRAFSRDPAVVTMLGRAVAEGLGAGGVLPVMKHIPGHGRAHTDTHLQRTVVDAPLADLEARDFAPFSALADLPMAMTAHVVYAAIDPERGATVSPDVIRDIVRGRIGFDGLLMSDDVSMHALSGDYAGRAAAIYAAGCDIVLHCNGRTEEMREIGGAAPALGGQSRERAARALQQRRNPAPFDTAAALDEYRALLARVGWPATS